MENENGQRIFKVIADAFIAETNREGGASIAAVLSAAGAFFYSTVENSLRKTAEAGSDPAVMWESIKAVIVDNVVSLLDKRAAELAGNIPTEKDNDDENDNETKPAPKPMH